MMGLSTSGIISLGWALVAGRNLVPSPAAGKTALQTCFFMDPRAVKCTANLSRNCLLLSRQLFEQRFQTLQHLLRLLLFQRELQHARRREVASRFPGNKSRQALRIERCALRKADADGVAAALNLRHTDTLRQQF